MDITRKENLNYDVAVLSLVLNFLGDGKKRGKMLIMCNTILKQDGLLFIVVPISCINNSLYLNHSLFLEIMTGLGFTQFPTVEKKCTAYSTASKLVFYCFKKHSLPNPKRKFVPNNLVGTKSSAIDFSIEV
eukprot:TRINITY_DN4429_c0_g1_i11.p1 TRINITY_DN4429_c0_g1~~TRINITY_DN4429_c0_g1_i11.p1  ORF type:complete len:131 (+),score=18.80 TRINITY_DN4429_c0_g1_i11:177-569(+)